MSRKTGLYAALAFALAGLNVVAITDAVAQPAPATPQPAPTGPSWRNTPKAPTPPPPKDPPKDPAKDPTPPKDPTPTPAPSTAMDMSVLPPITNEHPSPDDIAAAKKVYDAGAKEFDKGEYLRAIQAFEEAYGVAQRDGLIFSLAQAHRQQFLALGEYEHLYKGIQLYRIFLSRGKAGSRKGEAEKALKDLESIQSARAAAGTMPMTMPTKPAEKPVTSIAIDSPTPGVMISVDGADPEPPQVSMDVTTLDHTITLTAPGFIDKTVTLHAREGHQTAETFELEEKPGHIDLDLPAGAEVSIDGRFAGKAPFPKALEVKPGKRFVSVTLTGHQSQGQIVDVDRDGTKKLSFKMPTTTQRDASIGLFIAGGAILGGSAVLTGLAVWKQNQASTLFEKQPELQREDATNYAADVQDRNKYLGSAIATGSVAGLLGVIGVGLFVFDRAAPAPAPGDMGPSDKPAERKPNTMDMMSLMVVPLISPEFGGVSASLKF